MDDLGKGLGPMIVAVIMRRVGRENGLNIAMSMWALCAALLGIIACTLAHDEQRLQTAVFDDLRIGATST
jgi:hypothetical protein